MVIYITTNLVNGKQYIGKDTRNNPNYFGSGTLLRRAIEKYGKESFKKEIIEVCNSKTELIKREEYWLNYYDAGSNPNFYNMHNYSSGGLGVFGEKNHMYGKSHSEERKKIMRERMSGEKNPMYGKGYLFVGRKNHFYGKKHSTETINKIKEKRKLQVFSEESKRKMSKTLSERSPRGEQNHMFGKKGELCPNFKGYVICVSGDYKDQRKTSNEWKDIIGVSVSLVSSHLAGKKCKKGIKGNILKWEHDL
jgi:group I intron endonuclease